MKDAHFEDRIRRTETLLEQMETQWGICDTEVLHDIINKLKLELEELYAERKRRKERQRRIRVK